MDKREALAKAREKVAGKNTLEMHKQKEKIALSWINIFHYSTPSIIDYITHQSCKTGFAAKLQKENLVVAKEFPPRYWLPRKLLVLSKKGRDLLTFYRKDMIPWTGRIAEGHIWHDYLLQVYLAKKFKQNPRIGAAINSRVGHKIYDATCTMNNKKTGVEVEISRKKKYEVSNMLFYISQNFKAGKICKVEILYDTETIKNQFTNFIQTSTTKDGVCIFYLHKRYQGDSKYERTSTSIFIPREQLNLEFIELEIPPHFCPTKPKPKEKPKEPKTEEIEDPEEEIYENYFDDDDDL